MAEDRPKFQFRQDNNRNTNTTKPIKETELNAPVKTFDISKMQENNNEVNEQPQTQTGKKIGRPRKNKVYGTIRIQRDNVHRGNALQNVLNFETQDDVYSFMMDRLENSLDGDQKIMYDMYLKTYRAKDKRKI